MGKKGSKLTSDAVEAAEQLIGRIEHLGEVTQRKMFGGVGLFEAGSMFGIIDSKGAAFLKADDMNRAEFEEAGSVKHGRMPYYSIPKDVLGDSDTLAVWAKASIEAAHRSK